MKVVILQSNYLPWKGYFDLIHDADAFVFYDEVQYTKNDWRNRNRIYSSNGLQWLTIPIAREAVRMKISEVKVGGSDWQKLHFDSLYYAYKKAAYFAQLEPFMEEVYKKRSWEFLSQLNQYCIKYFCDFIGIETRFYDSTQFELKNGRIDKLIGVIEQIGANHYISGPAGQDYLTEYEPLFKSKNIELSYKDYSGYPEYKQMALPFQNYVSIVDMIAHVRREEIADYIWRRKNEKA